jgi:DNA-binding MarR family transcriptional regulator
MNYHRRMTATTSKGKSRSAASARASDADPAMEALRRFRLIFKSVKKHFSWVEQHTGVNGAQLWALAAVVEAPGLTVTELAKTLAVHQSTASNLVDKLVRQDLLRRERGEEDQRIVRLYPAAAGNRLVKRAPKPLQGVLPDALGRLGVVELGNLNALLDEVVRNMKVRDARGKSTPLAEI